MRRPVNARDCGYYTDHNHDDRYYTQAQVDTAIADAKKHSSDDTRRTRPPEDTSRRSRVGRAQPTRTSGPDRPEGRRHLICDASDTTGVPMGWERDEGWTPPGGQTSPKAQPLLL